MDQTITDRDWPRARPSLRPARTPAYPPHCSNVNKSTRGAIGTTIPLLTFDLPFAATVFLGGGVMTSGAVQAFMLSAGVFVASFVLIYVLKFIEQARGANAPSIEALTGARNLRK